MQHVCCETDLTNQTVNNHGNKNIWKVVELGYKTHAANVIIISFEQKNVNKC